MLKMTCLGVLYAGEQRDKNNERGLLERGVMEISTTSAFSIIRDCPPF